MSDVNKKLVQAKCREVLANYNDLLVLLSDEIYAEVDREEINGDTSFEYAKRFIRQRSVKEGIRLLLARLNKYANGN